MSTITKELAKLFRKITNSEIDAEGNAHVVLSPADSLLINNARIALASLEAEPVACIDQANLDYLESGDATVWPATSADAGDVLLYTAPQPLTTSERAELENYRKAQQVVPGSYVRDERGRMMLDGVCEPKIGFGAGWNACRASMLQGKAEPVTTAYKLPMQPLVIDAHGTLRFKENPIVRTLLDYATEHGYGLNEIALEQFDTEDQMQLAQLIGYSLSGYGTLSYVTDESYDRASAAAPQQESVSSALEHVMARYSGAMQKLADGGD